MKTILQYCTLSLTTSGSSIEADIECDIEENKTECLSNIHEAAQHFIDEIILLNENNKLPTNCRAILSYFRVEQWTNKFNIIIIKHKEWKVYFTHMYYNVEILWHI